MLMQSEIAGIGRRLLATVLDFVILHLVLTVVLRNMQLSPEGVWMVGFSFIFIVIYSAIFVGSMGQTPGKMLLRLRVIDAHGGGLNYVQTFRRAVVKWSPVFVLFIVMALLTPEELDQRPSDGEGIEVVEVETQSGVALLTAMVIGTVGWIVLIHMARRHPDGQGIHDRVAETYVIS